MLTSIWTQICRQHNTDSSLTSQQPGVNGISGHFLRGLHDVVAHQRDSQTSIQQSEMSLQVKCDQGVKPPPKNHNPNIMRSPKSVLGNKKIKRSTRQIWFCLLDFPCFFSFVFHICVYCRQWCHYHRVFHACKCETTGFF